MKCLLAFALVAGLAAPAFAEGKKSPSSELAASLGDINQRLLAMAEDMPEAKYSYRPAADVRSFGEVIVHVMGGNAYGAKVARDPKAKWEEVDAKSLPNKAAVVAAFKKHAADAEAALKSVPASKLAGSIEPWLDIIEHAGEHYGQLVAYYRVNGMVPPASRKK